MVWLFILCLLIAPLKPIAMSKEIPLASANSQTTPKTDKEIEYDVKAAFIYNFMKFVEWPEKDQTEESQQSDQLPPMIIGVLGNNPFGNAFLPIIGKDIQGRKIYFVEIDSYSAFYEYSRNQANAWNEYREQYQEIIRKCDVLFICDSEKKYTANLLSLTSGNTILTISDIPQFAENKGMVGFVKDNNKIRFDVNFNNANKENIKIRAQLLKLARTVYRK